jgi:hypothetical protein
VKIPFGESTAVGRPFIDLSLDITIAILQTIAAGWEIAREHPEVHPRAMEVPMTECLRDGMRRVLRDRRLPWRIIVAPGTESRSQAGMTIPDGRTDIPLFVIEIFLQQDEHDPHAIIECKRIAASDATLVREYVVAGMNRFRDGRYGGNHGIGFMAGYILSGAPSSVVEGINGFLHKHGRGVERLEPLALLDGDWAWISRHERIIASRPIELNHALLSITSAWPPHREQVR